MKLFSFGLLTKTALYILYYSIDYTIKLILQQQILSKSMDARNEEDLSEQSGSLNYSQMTEVERQAEFRRQHQQYIAEKMARKKQILKLRKEQFGSSSSDESDQDLPMGSDSSRSSIQKKELQFTKQKKEVKVLNPTVTKENAVDLQKIPINSLGKKGGEWAKDVLVFQSNSISLLNQTFNVKGFTKIKIISQTTCGYPYRIKINFDNSQILFSPAVGANQQKNGLLINYYAFAKIIQQKLVSQGIKLKQHKQQKIPGVPESLVNNSYVYGRLNKKSQVLGKWEQRFIVINKQGIFSYKKFNEKHTMQIATGSIKQMWTRFEIIDELLVVKTMHNSKKTQFGLPLCQVLSKNSWLYHFFGVMNKK